MRRKIMLAAMLLASGLGLSGCYHHDRGDHPGHPGDRPYHDDRGPG